MAAAILCAAVSMILQRGDRAMAAEETGRPVQAGIEIRDFLAERSLTRVGNPVVLEASVCNESEASSAVSVRLGMSAGVRIVTGDAEVRVELEPGACERIAWSVAAERPVYAEFRVTATVAGGGADEDVLPIRFLAPVDPSPRGVIPPPKALNPRLLVGAHHCPLWEADKPGMWTQIRKHPERVPALGYYAQENPEVADWETTWAAEHGISFFIYCWYRTSEGGPVEHRFGSAIHDALFKSRHADALKFTIMWENQVRERSGVADEADLMENLLPYWMENYFTHDSYLKVDNKPVLFIYRPEFLVQDLGSVEKVREAFGKMREACRQKGFAGLYLLGEYRGLDPNHLNLMKSLGLDYTFAYCWHVQNNPTPEQAIAAQMQSIRKTQELGILPQVVTVSQAWSGWHDEGSIWKIPPTEFEDLLTRAKDFIGELPADELGSRMLLLDNWNEWGEGHYVAPYTEYGFGYVDAVRKVLAENDEPHRDLLPEDLGLGPYDAPYREFLARQREMKKLLGEKVLGPGGAEAGLIGRWTFDEAPDSPVALDVSGNRRGGILNEAARAPGKTGSALVCDGGSLTVPAHPAWSVGSELTLECVVRTDVPRQVNTWIVNRVLSGGTDTGYRLGLLDGKPCFEVPLTTWSHHLTADVEMPLGTWVHLAGTFDGTTMRIYVDGKLRGTMDRPGPVKPNGFPLCIGNFDVGHDAHFAGWIDEVSIYSRVLSDEEIARRARR